MKFEKIGEKEDICPFSDETKVELMRNCAITHGSCPKSIYGDSDIFHLCYFYQKGMTGELKK